VELEARVGRDGTLMRMSRPNTWPARSVYTGRWCHSDLKDVAYFYVFKFYEKVIEKGGLR